MQDMNDNDLRMSLAEDNTGSKNIKYSREIIHLSQQSTICESYRT